MDEKITYGVICRTKENPDEWRFFSAWFDSHETAIEESKIALRNPRFSAVRIVERVESFQTIEEWEDTP